MAPKREVAIHLRAIDEFSKVFQNVSNKALPDLAKSVAGLAAGFVSVRAAVGVMQDAIHNALEAEKATAALTAALNSQKISVQANLPHLTAFAGAMSRVTAATDEEIQGAQKLLISVGGLLGPKLDAATKASLDLAAGLGIGLTEAAEKVAKAANGSVKEFTRLGLKFQDNATDAEKLDTVLQFIDRRFGGAAQAQVETFAGKIDELSKAWGELEEAFGKQATGTKLPGILETLTQALNVAAQGIDSGKVKDTLKLFEGVADFNPGSLLELFDRIERLKIDDNVAAMMAGKFAEDADPVLQNYIRNLDKIIADQDAAAKATEAHAKAIRKIVDTIESQSFGPQKSQPKTPITGESSDFVLKSLVDETDAVAKQKAEWQKMVAIIDDAHFGLIQFGETLDVVSVNTNEWAETLQAALEGSLTNAALQFGDTLVDAAFGAKVNWEEAIKSILAGIAKAIVNAVILKSLEGVFAFSGGGVVPGASITESFAAGGVAYAAGGMFTPRGTDTVPAMLTPGEIVVPHAASQSILGGRAALVGPGGGGGGPVTVNIYALDGADVERVLTRNPRALSNALDHLEARGYR